MGTQASEGRRETLPHTLSHILSPDFLGGGGRRQRARGSRGAVSETR